MLQHKKSYISAFNYLGSGVLAKTHNRQRAQFEDNEKE